MTDLQKQPFVEASEKDKQRHESQVKEMKLNGFFMSADGVKSTDLKPKAPKKRAAPEPGSAASVKKAVKRVRKE